MLGAPQGPFTVKLTLYVPGLLKTCVGLSTGTYTVTITDGNGCTTNSTAIINSPSSAVAVEEVPPDGDQE